jgi:hypothetical protein
MPMSSSNRAFQASGQILDREPAGEQLLLELEAQDHVQPVARLVGVDADERAAHAVDRAMEVLERHTAERTRERRLHARVEPAPERQGPTDHVLPQPALRLVQRRGDSRRERRALERPRHAPLVEAVPALVHRGEEREEVVLGIAAREADVSEPERDLERVHRRVEPELVPVAPKASQSSRERASCARSGTAPS